MSINKPHFKWYVVNVQTIAIDSGWEFIHEATDRATALKNEGVAPGAVKVMTKPRVGSVTLDPNDDASWTPKRANPRGRLDRTTYGGSAEDISDDEVEELLERHPVTGEIVSPREPPSGVHQRPVREKRPSPEPNPKRGSRRRRNPGAVCTCDPRFISADCEVHGEIQPGSLWIRQGRVHEVDNATTTTVVVCDVVTGECRNYNMRDFLVQFSCGPKENPRHNPSDFVVEEGLGGTGVIRSRGAKPTAVETRNVLVQMESERPGIQVHRSSHGWQQEADGSWTLDFHKINTRENPRRTNPGELLIVNPSNDFDSARAEKVYEMWHQKEPHSVSVRRPGRINPGESMVRVGRAHNIVYRSGKWEQGKKTNDYVHHFDSKPSVYMLASCVDDVKENPSKTVESLLRSTLNGDGQIACADLATPLSFGLDDGTAEGADIIIHKGSRVYGAVDRRTVVIEDPTWGLIVIKGGQMRFDERGIIK